MLQFKSNIIKNRKIAENHFVISFKRPKKLVKINAGQFFNVKVNDSLAPLLRRPLGTHKVTKDTIEMMYKVVGGATEILSKRAAGSPLDIVGPLGNGFDISQLKPKKKKCAHAILVAGGHGVAPLYELARRVKKCAKTFSVYIGANTKSEVLFQKDFHDMGFKVNVTTEDGSAGHKGLVTELLEKDLNKCDPILTSIYACGPKPMLKAVTEVAKRCKTKCQISYEEYIACGIGVCMGCAVKTRTGYKLVCKDGPIFRAEEIIWQD